MPESLQWGQDIEEPMKGDDKMPFGKHKDKELDDVPAEYLLWMWEQEWVERKFPALYAYLEKVKDALEEEVGERSVHDPTEPFPFCFDESEDFENPF